VRYPTHHHSVAEKLFAILCIAIIASRAPIAGMSRSGTVIRHHCGTQLNATDQT
jgi:hypothetical protein